MLYHSSLHKTAEISFTIGAAFTFMSSRQSASTISALSRNPEPQKAMRLFGYSISYVTLLFGVLTLDVLVRHGF